MSRTQLTGNQVGDSSIQRRDLDTITVGQAVATRLIAGSNITLTSTGIDLGTGDVTISTTQGADLSSKADITYVDAQDAKLAVTIATKTDITNYSISTVNAATRLIQTQGIVASMALRGNM